MLAAVFAEVGEGAAFAGIAKKSGHSTPARYFQRHQINRLKTAILEADPELWLYIQFIYYCALRPNGEVRRLKADDIMLEAGQIRVRGEIAKNKKTQYVKIPAAFLQELQFVRRLDPDAWLFPSRQDISKPIGYNTMTTRHRKFLRELGFGPEYKLYSWKHTGAVEAIRAGVHPKELQIHLRHATLEETDGYLRQLGVGDFSNLGEIMPEI